MHLFPRFADGCIEVMQFIVRIMFILQAAPSLFWDGTGAFAQSDGPLSQQDEQIVLFNL